MNTYACVNKPARKRIPVLALIIWRKKIYMHEQQGIKINVYIH